MYKLGCHLSTSNGFKNMGETALSIDANTFQFFSRNPRGGAARKLDQNDLDGLSKIMEENSFANILVHAPYTLNMASSNSKTREFAKMVFSDDLNRLERMPCQLYTFHPGSHSGQGLEKGIDNIVEIMNFGITEETTTYVLLETMSGKGTEIGSKFEEIAEIMSRIHYADKIGVCLDTCHLFSAGYDIVNDLDGVLEKFDHLVGLEKVMAIHLNDSMNPYNSHKDRHAGIGQGEMGLDALIAFISHPNLKHLPFILETPYDTAGHKEEIKLLRDILDK